MRQKRPKDRVYAEPRASVGRFCFDSAVARVFEDMIERSVPGYATTLEMISVLAARYVAPGSRCYDLGCSLGAASLALQRGIRVPGCTIVAIDDSPAMLAQARRRLPAPGGQTPIELRQGDIRDTPVNDASMVVLNFPLQFISPAERPALLGRIHAGLRPGGVLLLSEKIRFREPDRERLMTELHHAFKRANGYNELEIGQKRQALEEVLVPETLEVHRARLAAAGFRRVEPWFQCFNFASLVAFR
ncbi:MAG TPA: carboxy-S-adenosyl-L-methionine synthase CmoA [Sedimenticola sp.]|nr:carboxy-S-adenosyl-L-methionine synthase CmoA [Sedimenticola sp.]